MARHRRLVLAVWAVLLVGCTALYPSLKEVLSEPDYGVEGSQSSQAEALLAHATFRGSGSEQDVIVFHSATLRAGDPAYRVVVARTLSAVRRRAGVEGVGGPYGVMGRHGASGTGGISRDRRAAFAWLALGGSARQRFKRVDGLQRVIVHAGDARVQAWLTGYSPLAKDLAQAESSNGDAAEAIGVPLAFAVMMIALGAFAAATVPLLLAGSGVLLTFGVIDLLGRVLDFDAFLLTIVTMIGVGIGIDYSLFVVSRFREELARLPCSERAERRRIAQAMGAAIATSGRTIFYSGFVVALSLTSLLVLRSATFREFAIGTSISVVCTLAAALTLLPATLAQLGDRINAGSLSERLQPADSRPGALDGYSAWARWARAMTRRPATASLAVIALLLAAAAPVLGLRSGITFGSLSSLSHTPSGEGAQVLARSFSVGLMGPLEVAVTGTGDRRFAIAPAHRAPARTASALAAELRRDRRVAGVTVRPAPFGALLTVVSAVPVDSTAAQALVRRIRTKLAPAVAARERTRVLVGGWSAQAVDAAQEIMGKLPLVLALALAMALAFLLVIFRSIVLPLKAIAMNLLATTATLGLVVLIFQDGHGGRLLGFTSPGYIQAHLPLTMFVLLFGLSMDYEIFLIRRMQETWHATADNRAAIVSGVEHTARPISAAAAIMVAVFGSGVTASILELKQFGFALAAAIAIDATLIRLVLVPALMCLLGARNWWLPERLGRVLPRLEID